MNYRRQQGKSTKVKKNFMRVERQLCDGFPYIVFDQKKCKSSANIPSNTLLEHTAVKPAGSQLTEVGWVLNRTGSGPSPPINPLANSFNTVVERCVEAGANADAIPARAASNNNFAMFKRFQNREVERGLCRADRTQRRVVVSVDLLVELYVDLIGAKICVQLLVLYIQKVYVLWQFSRDSNEDLSSTSRIVVPNVIDPLTCTMKTSAVVLAFLAGANAFSTSPGATRSKTALNTVWDDYSGGIEFRAQKFQFDPVSWNAYNYYDN
jgi:hypothetical protein